MKIYITAEFEIEVPEDLEGIGMDSYVEEAVVSTLNTRPITYTWDYTPFLNSELV